MPPARRQLADPRQHRENLAVDHQVLDVRADAAKARLKLQSGPFVLSVAQRRPLMDRDDRMSDGDLENVAAIIARGEVCSRKQGPMGNALNEAPPEEEGRIVRTLIEAFAKLSRDEVVGRLPWQALRHDLVPIEVIAGNNEVRAFPLGDGNLLLVRPLIQPIIGIKESHEGPSGDRQRLGHAPGLAPPLPHRPRPRPSGSFSQSPVPSVLASSMTMISTEIVALRQGRDALGQRPKPVTARYDDRNIWIHLRAAPNPLRYRIALSSERHEPPLPEA